MTKLSGKQVGDPEGPNLDDPQRLVLEARLVAAYQEIDAVLAEAEHLWPDVERRWEAIIQVDRSKSYLFHGRLPKNPDD